MSNNTGWICPRCNTVNAPWTPVCACGNGGLAPVYPIPIPGQPYPSPSIPSWPEWPQPYTIPPGPWIDFPNKITCSQDNQTFDDVGPTSPKE